MTDDMRLLLRILLEQELREAEPEMQRPRKKREAEREDGIDYAPAESSTQYFDDIAAGNDAKLGIQGLYQLHVGVVYAIKYYRVNIFKNNQFFYH